LVLLLLLLLLLVLVLEVHECECDWPVHGAVLEVMLTHLCTVRDLQ
jgi:hypothetical protein